MRKLFAIILAVVIGMISIAAAASGEGIEGIKARDYISFGRYPQTKAGTDQTPIDWLVLEVKDGKALLVSKYGLDCKRYNEGREDTTWETCSVRAWLNSDFLNTAFNQEEQNVIVTTTVDNSESQRYSEHSTSGGNDTQDKVFLLSYHEVYDVYFPREDDRVCAPTDYAIKNGAWTNGKKQQDGRDAGAWWLRSPGGNQNYATDVSYNGARVDFYADIGDIFVRPALWIDLNSGFFGNGGQQPGTGSAGGQEPQQSSDAFVFRNNVVWGMNQKQVIAQESGEYEAREGNTHNILYFRDSKVSKYDGALLGYLFTKDSDSLDFAWYYMKNGSQAMYDYFRKAFDLKYGEEKNADPQELRAIHVAAHSESNAKLYKFEDYPILRWDGPAGTQIWMYMEARDGNDSIHIYFVSPELMNPSQPQEEGIDLTGL